MAGYTSNACTVNYVQQVWTLWSSNVGFWQGNSGAITNTAIVWNVWNSPAATAACSINSRTWTSWIITPSTTALIRPPTAEETERWRQQRLAQQAEARRHVAQLDAAHKRAEALLREHLTPEQREDLEKKNLFYLDVLSKDGTQRRYRIDRGSHGNVKLVDKDKRIVEQLCVQPDGVPIPDTMLAQKLWLETNEEEFRRTANIRRVG